MAKVRVIALEPGFINAVKREAGEEFSVLAGQEVGVSWFRPVVVDSIPNEDPGDDDKAAAKPKPQRKAKKPDAEDLG